MEKCQQEFHPGSSALREQVRDPPVSEDLVEIFLEYM